MNKKVQIKIIKTKFIVNAIFLFLLTMSVNITYSAATMNSAIDVKAQIKRDRVTLNIKNQSAKYILSEIEKITGIGYAIKSNISSEELNNLSLNVNNVTVEEALNQLFANSKYSYEISNNIITVVRKLSTTTNQANNRIDFAARVVNKDGKMAIAGATILVKNSKEGAISDDKGEFILRNVAVGAELEVSYVGMKALVIKVSDKSQKMLIEMEPDALAVSDVVITGIYERKKDSFTGSSSTFTNKELKSIGTQNIIQSLKSLDPALNIIENNQYGSDPNRTPDMEIRGKSSVVGLKEQYGEDPNQPLFILDGFETTLAVIMDLSLDRVASVTILKDAASTAIYGGKAANGVIVVETKTPEQGKLRLSYNGNLIASFADLSAYNLMNAKEKLEFELKAGRFNTNLPTLQEDLNNRYNNLYNEVLRGVDTYWLAEPLRYGLNHRHGVNVDGGNDEIRYGIGFTYNQNNGVMKQSNRDIAGGNIDLVYRKGKFSLSNKLTIDYRISANPIVAFSEFSRANPYYRKTNEQGGYDKFLEDNSYKNAANYSPSLYQVSNPMWNYLQSSYDKNREFAMRNNTSLEYRIHKTIRIRMRFGVGKNTNETEVFVSPEDTRFANVEIVKKGTYRNNRNDGFNYSGDLSLTYGNLIAKYHQVNIVVGGSMNENSSVSKGYSSEGFPNGGFTLPSFANKYPDSSKPSYSDYLKRATSLFFNGGYSFKNRYLLDVNYRLDGSSVFGSNKRFTTTWSTGLAWNLHQEAFMSNLKQYVSVMKLRASVGNPSNQNFGSFQTVTTYGFSNWMQNNFGTGVIINSFGNNDLDWQKTLDKNIGLDLTLLGNRLHINADYYDKLTDPLLAYVSIPLSVGASTKLMNIGKQVSRGFNGTVKYAILYKPEKRVNWTIGVSMRNGTTYFDNIGEQLSQSNRENLSKSLVRYYDKAKTSYLWSVRSLGIDSATGQELFLKKDGNYTFEYSAENEVVVGDSSPTLDGVISSNLRFKGFSFSLSMRYSFGGDAFNSTLYNKVENISSDGLKRNQDRRALYDRWQKPGDIAKYKSISLTSSTRISSRFVQPNDYFSLESIRVGYEVENKFLNEVGISGLNVNAYMNEIFRIGTMRAERGIDYPFARSISFSLSFNF